MAMYLTAQQSALLKETFDLIDLNRDSKINHSDIKAFFNNLQVKTEYYNDQFFSSLKTMEDIGFNDFKNIVGPSVFKRTDYDKEKDYKHCFSVFDKEQKGKISKPQIQQVLSKLNIHLSPAEVDEIITFADVDGDKLVDYEEFVKILVEVV